MLMINGEVRKVIESSYTDKSGNKVPQATVIIEPSLDRSNYEISISKKYIDQGVLKIWEAAKGRQVSVPVTLYVNHDHRFHKFNLSGDGKPLPVKS